MSGYSISPTFNKNRVFILQKSELENRFDPFFYVPELLELEKKIKEKKYNKLNQICEPFKNGSTPKDGNFSDTGILYYRSQDFDLFELKENQFITEEFNNQIERSEVKVNDIMLAVVGATLGKVGFIDNKSKEGNINQNVARIRLSSNEYLPKFIALFLSTEMGQKQIKRNATITTQAYLNNVVLGNILIPYVSIKEQEKIIETFNKTTLQKQTNEIKADKLLSSIDDYLLKELGIKLPEPPENTLKNRMFVSNISELSGRRFDPYHHQVGFIKIIEAIRKAKYPVSNFKHYIADLKNGVEIRNYVEEGGIRYLRVTDLGKNGLNHKSPRFVLEQEIPDRIKLNENCILISRSGSLGLVNVAEPEIENSILSSHIFKIELKTEKLLPVYLEAYLRSKVGQSEIFRNNSGGVIPEINQDALKSILIVCPPIDKQKEIADHITGIRQQAQQLKDKTSELLKKASEEIEKILIG